MRAVALLAVFNEERFIAACMDHLIAQGLQVYVIDNGSTDRTAAIARNYLGRGLLGIEAAPRHGIYTWRPLLERKEELALTLDADWFMHVDADEFRLPPRAGCTLAEAFAEVERAGCNAVNFLEFAFVPTAEAPDHDHADFRRTMRWYYAFVPPCFPNRLNAWKKQPARVELAWSGGHQVRFPGLRMYALSFPMRHYLYLSVPHAVRKYVDRTYDPTEIERGWHRARAGLRRETVVLPRQSELRTYRDDVALDASNPRTRHALFGADVMEIA